MKTTFLKSILFMAMAVGIFTSCVNDDDYAIPTMECNEPNITANKTVEEVYAMATSAAVQYTAADTIRAVVVSSDKGGNFYKTIYMNNIVTEDGQERAGEIGFAVQVNQTDLFTDFGVGRVVYIALKDLYIQNRNNTLQIGALYNGNIGQIAAELYESHIFRTCTILEEDKLINVIPNLSQITDAYLGRLVKLETVQFSDASLGQTYYNATNVDGGGQTLTYIIDTEGNDGEENIALPFRTSSFADYAGLEVPAESGSITGVLTKFGDIYQFVSRYAVDIQLTEPRQEIPCEFEELTVTKTVQEIFNMATSAATQYTADDIISGIIVSTDQEGHFYKSLYLVSEDQSIGFTVPVDQVDLFNRFEIGRKVYIKLKDLYIQKLSNTLNIGALFNGNVGRITESASYNVISKSCDVFPEADITEVVTDLSAIDDSYIGKLIRLEGVQFTDASLGQTFFNSSNTDAGGQTLTYITDSEEEVNSLPFRTSSFASFADMQVPSENGTITGVLTKYNSTYQFVARRSADLDLSNARIGDLPTGSLSALGGTDISYTGSFTENFESYAVGANTFPKYVNDNTTGDRYWQLKQFSNNKYIEMSSYNGSSAPGVPANSYFFVPVDFTAASTFSFDKEIRYMAGVALKVYYVTAANYQPGELFNVSTFTDITSSFTGLTYPATGQSQNNFTTAGTYNIPSGLTGNGFFVFEYVGSATVTTTIQIDNIAVN